MIAFSPRSPERSWGTVSFASTLRLCPILDLLLSDIPSEWRAELRLGLQEALVNAAKHGNNLDPNKTILVRFSIVENVHWWVISDQGSGFEPPCLCDIDIITQNPQEVGEQGRGLYILRRIFDQVDWDNHGTELKLCKRVKNCSALPLVR
ncbi:MAG: anti-sigma regulatory factor [Cyanothece sp. SIO1E1]|nr:anti-sigma regulatory factor [Cyanothece sp. SIO1E1]